MKLNIVIPTYNRAASLRRTLLSLAAAEMPPNFEVEVIVVDNNSTDKTRQIVEDMTAHFFKIKLEYLFEAKQGKSFAFNTGVLRSDGELFSGIDDDIEIAKDWFVELEKVFRKNWETLDFVGGKMLPHWETSAPSWIEPLKSGVISWRDYGEEEWTYTLQTPMLTGGHSAFKRKIFDEISLLPEGVGPTGKNLMVCNDDVFFDKLMSADKKGIYCPKLVFYHYVPAYRLSKSYYRQWCFSAGISKHLMDTHYKKIEGARILDTPRWMYRTALNGVAAKIKNVFNRNETESLAAENQPLVIAGFFYGKHLQNSWLDKPLQTIAKRFVKSAER